MNNTLEYNEIMAFHPGYYIAEMIEDMGISQAEFALRLGTTPKNLSTLVNGQISLSNDIAKKLSVMTGTSAEVWLNLQVEYDKKTIEIEKKKDLDAQLEIVSAIDYSFFTKYAGLKDTKKDTEKISRLCEYFMIADLRVLCQPDFLFNFKEGVQQSSSVKILNSRAWLQTAINISEKIETERFSSEKLKAALPELRKMTIKESREFVPDMSRILSQCGVAFVLLPNLKNSIINGAVKWLNHDRVVLAVNTSDAYTDNFWFLFFREIKHILQQKIKTTFICGAEMELEGLNAALADEAECFSKEYLIPSAKLTQWGPNSKVTEKEINAFAESINVNPGIVVGRLRQENIISENKCNKFKHKYAI